MKYITKPCEIEAVEWTGKNAAEILQFTNTENVNIVFGIPVISTFNGEMRADVGDYIIRGLRGEYYPCKPDVFHAKYEPCEEQEQREEQEQHKMNKQEKEDFIIRKTYELNRIFVNYKVSKDKQKAMNEQMNEVKKIHRELIVNYIAEMEDVINPMSNAVTPAIAAALTLVLKAIESDMTAADIAFKDVLCIWNREVVNCEEDAKS
jgi:hypothetical protein|nr:MAG TPA: PGDYG protein [Caudoviricetes sp.]